MADSPSRPLSLLEELQSGSGYEAGLLATYSSYAPFVEEVVLPRLRATGCHYLMVLVDRAQLACELAERGRRPSAAGRKYGLLPIACGGAFHPKLALLVGPKNARMIVGSHNLTMSGVIQNREVTNVLDISGPKDRAGAAALIEALDFCAAWSASLPPALRSMVEEFRGFCGQYLGPVPEDSAISVVGSRPSGASLWQRVRRLLPGSARRAVVLAPFFDQRLSFVEHLVEELALQELVIGVDSETACFPGDIKKLPRKVRVVEAHDLSPGHRGRGSLHAKAILVEDRSGQTVITGSANSTAAAWLAPPASRNAELVVVRRLSKGEPDHLGLARLAECAPVEPARLSRLRSRPEVAGPAGKAGAILVGICHGTTVHIEGAFRAAGAVVIRDPRGTELPSVGRIGPTELVVELQERPHDANSIEAKLDGVHRFGFVHHPDLLREAALSSSQRRVREALRGLNGDDTQLEGLLRLVEKVIFDAPAAPIGTERKAKALSESKKGDAKSSVVVVASLKEGAATEQQRLSTGDLGLLLDYLMRKLWQSLSHEPAPAPRSELELIDADEEEPPPQPITDRRIAENWHRKSRTLLRRLSRRVDEGGQALQIVFEAAAVLGVLEAVRRVEDQDRWRPLHLDFVDRDAGALFLLKSVPRLLTPGQGVLDLATAAAGAPFAEQQSLVEWLVWLAWLTGFGPAEVWVDRDQDEREAEAEVADRLARACLIGARAAQIDTKRVVELLEASPFPGTDGQPWLDALVRLGETFANPRAATTLRRAPQAGDLVLTHSGSGPYVVRCVRGSKIDLIVFSREEHVAVFMTSTVRVLDSGIKPVLRAIGY